MTSSKTSWLSVECMWAMFARLYWSPQPDYYNILMNGHTASSFYILRQVIQIWNETSSCVWKSAFHFLNPQVRVIFHSADFLLMTVYIHIWPHCVSNNYMRALLSAYNRSCMLCSEIENSKIRFFLFKELQSEKDISSVCDQRYVTPTLYLDIPVFYRFTVLTLHHSCNWNDSSYSFVAGPQSIWKRVLESVGPSFISLHSTVCSITTFKTPTLHLIKYPFVHPTFLTPKPVLLQSSAPY